MRASMNRRPQREPPTAMPNGRPDPARPRRRSPESASCEHDLLAEIRLDDFGILRHLERLALGDLLAVIEHDHAIDHAHECRHDVLHPDDGDAELAPDAPQHVGGARHLRAIPRWQTASGVSRVMSSPRKVIVPAVGVSAPEMQLNAVVLPEPLGPISPRISPSRTSNATALRAMNPPNLFVNPSTVSMTWSELEAGSSAGFAGAIGPGGGWEGAAEAPSQEKPPSEFNGKQTGTTPAAAPVGSTGSRRPAGRRGWIRRRPPGRPPRRAAWSAPPLGARPGG